jgi:hypothetical protein
MPKFGSTNRDGHAPKFSGTGAGFLTQAALLGELVAATPVEIVRGKYNEGKPGERETVRLKADVVVLTGPNKGEHPGMLLSGGKIVETGQRILNEKADEVILGRPVRTPLKAYKAQWATPAALEAAIADPNVVVPSNAFAWLIPDANASDVASATAYYSGGGIPDSPESEDERDPFEDD